MKKISTTLLALLISTPVLALDINVNVSQISSDKGGLVVQVYDSEDTWLSDDTVLSKRYELQPGDSAKTVIIPIELEAGNYALSVYHDENDNKKLDANFIGIPKEPVGLSNDHRPKFGPPKYRKAEIEVSEGTVIEIKMD
ncbi:uncharacterized protein (DUF2141 family) [Litorivivens lipolytica]|uniref:Uncharacterized protein (DUF2141 family) n=1 Tax=Litorivivens lipolytica TaxID=1524264 RepID=A0A7W4W5T2_9GAMM|nr:DUF2141 domain-containing protein [Litorivivens lipolytica]MBB3047965.1 uncharacterized protein (DUF2141 family) [Litorivivens lipolytica]